MRTPRRRPALYLIGPLAALALAGCAGESHQVQLPPASMLVSTDFPDPVFAAAPSILSGFDVATTPNEWQIGDQVLVGIRVTKPGSDAVRLLGVELIDRLNPYPSVSFTAHPKDRPTYRFDSSLLYTRLTLYDQAGQLLDTAVGRFPYKLMGHGLFDGAAPSLERPRLADGSYDMTGVGDEQAEHELLGWLSLFSFSGSLGRKGMFNEMLKDVMARPSLLAMLLNPTVALETGGGDILRRDWVPATGQTVDGVTVPLACSIAGKAGVVAQVWAARPVAPLGLTGGVVSIIGNNADKPDVRFEVRLLAAKRGTGGRAFLPTEKDPVP